MIAIEIKDFFKRYGTIEEFKNHETQSLDIKKIIDGIKLK